MIIETLVLLAWVVIVYGHYRYTRNILATIFIGIGAPVLMAALLRMFPEEYTMWAIIAGGSMSMIGMGFTWIRPLNTRRSGGSKDDPE